MSPAESSSASIGKSVEIRGEVKGSEDLIVDGHIEGTITLTDSRLTIGPTARVDADVSARDVIILGILNGNVHASVRVELRKGANLTGDIQAARLSIEEGSIFSGRVDLSQGPTAAAAAPVKGASGAASPPASAIPVAAGGLFTPPKS
jgi:cytoskeletal protein CcmA (bactofilin family)